MMITSKQVFAKRREGPPLEAYNMALELVSYEPDDPWNTKAHVYCLIDMVKLAVSSDDSIAVQNYVDELNEIDIDQSDEILIKSVQRAKRLANPETRIVFDARELSKQGKHAEAARAYRIAMSKFPEDLSLYENLSWELYRIGKNLFGADKVDVYLTKKLLAEYIRLKNQRPSRLHSLFLRHADKLIGSEGFNLVAFLKLWDLSNLTEEDYQPYEAGNGKIYPSIAEKVIQHAAKDALNKRLSDDVGYLLPFVDGAINRYPENFWLTYYKAKLLHLIGEDNKALEFSISVVKNKITEYWSWGLLAEILLNIDRGKAFSCYCKALLCGGEPKFLVNVRIQTAKLLVQNSLFDEARYEIDEAIKSRENEGWKLTEELIEYQNSDWYLDATATEDNKSLYEKYASDADVLLFEAMPWFSAVVGKTFALQHKPNKKRRKVYIALPERSTPLEVAVPENKYSFNSLVPGNGIRIKGEVDQQNRYQVYLIDSRESATQWDIFTEHVGVVDHINHGKKIAHFIVDRNIDGILHFSEFPIKFKLGDTLG